MRSYLDIIIDLKEGRKPDYEEVRLACIMANDLLYFAEQDIKRVLGIGHEVELAQMDKEKLEKRNNLVSNLARSNLESRFKSRKLSPEEFLGNHHPDHPEQKASMERSKQIYKAFCKEYGYDNREEE